MSRREIAEQACRRVLEVEPANYFIRSVLEAMRAFPEQYPTPKQWFWIKAKVHAFAVRERCSASRTDICLRS